MTLRGCMQCFKYSVFLLNFIIWLSGLFILGLAIYLRMDPTLNHMATVGYTPHVWTYHFLCYFLAFFGIVVTFLGFLGCCSSYQESYTMLAFFLGILILFLVAEVGLSSWLVVQRKNVKHSVEDTMKEYIMQDYGVDLFTDEPVDHVQEIFKCCGGSGPYDYLLSNWHNSSHAEQPQSRKCHPHCNHDRRALVVPASCCDSKSKKSVVCVAEHPRKDPSRAAASKSLRSTSAASRQGCASHIHSTFEKVVERSCIFALAIGSVQLLSLIFSLCICCGLRRRFAGGYKS